MVGFILIKNQDPRKAEAGENNPNKVRNQEDAPVASDAFLATYLCRGTDPTFMRSCQTLRLKQAYSTATAPYRQRMTSVQTSDSPVLVPKVSSV